MSRKRSILETCQCPGRQTCTLWVRMPPVAGATITQVAHRHDVTRQQIYTWRGELKKKGLLSASANTLFIPVDMNSVQTGVPEDSESRSGMIELRLSCGRILRFGSAVDTSALTQLIRAVEAV
ncbi:IS66 family insertion sequence hypothetical protein [Agrobacterium rosae]|nr:IS66 family insertion sequence hypothetical protein [Agrobacterium rosae]KAA3513550.1 IS66 family insertion sequence hypothetical protein [Agrobacterium rosae]MQB51092.1 IS66 family insertion sequence hypothetical protein [Agrobacterium rosae]